jgi:DNA recombination protein RmuC
MEPLQILAVLLLLAVLAILLYNSFVKKEPQKGDDKSMLLLQQQIQELTRTMDQRLGESSRSIQESMQRQLSESNKIVGDVTEKLTQLGETNKQVIGFTEQLRQLQDVLKNPKQRGVLGEYYLETVLQNVLPPGSFKMQYAFENGEIVDAAVFVKDKVIPIDSKFSLENYNRMIEAHEPS